MAYDGRRVKGKKHWNWKGGVHINSWGYLRYNPTTQINGKCVGGKFVHVVTLEKKLGRKLKPNERTHHINGNKLDNRPENLEAITIKEHNRIHKPHSNLKRHPKYGYFIKGSSSKYKEPKRNRNSLGQFV